MEGIGAVVTVLQPIDWFEDGPDFSIGQHIQEQILYMGS